MTHQPNKDRTTTPPKGNDVSRIVSGSSFRKETYTLDEVKEIAKQFTRMATPSKFINGIDERFEKVWKLNFGG